MPINSKLVSLVEYQLRSSFQSLNPSKPSPAPQFSTIITTIVLKLSKVLYETVTISYHHNI